MARGPNSFPRKSKVAIVVLRNTDMNPLEGFLWPPVEYGDGYKTKAKIVVRTLTTDLYELVHANSVFATDIKLNTTQQNNRVLRLLNAEWLVYRSVKSNCFHHSIYELLMICFFVCFVALHPKSAAMVIAGRSVHLTTLFSWASLKKQLISTSCTYFRL